MIVSEGCRHGPATPLLVWSTNAVVCPGANVTATGPHWLARVAGWPSCAPCTDSETPG